VDDTWIGNKLVTNYIGQTVKVAGKLKIEGDMRIISVPAEIPDLIDDLISLFRRCENRTVAHINQELEALGWGVDLLDESLFQEILSDLVGTDELLK
jgi:hypothetical protein